MHHARWGIQLLVGGIYWENFATPEEAVRWKF